MKFPDKYLYTPRNKQQKLPENRASHPTGKSTRLPLPSIFVSAIG